MVSEPLVHVSTAGVVKITFVIQQEITAARKFLRRCPFARTMSTELLQDAFPLDVALVIPV